ncbi:MAG: F0F1 ATP synthase subunit delta [Desulfovibrio sp.]|nr:F0F1 ATP synthase subunit delta [Desulfovibrio sp.]
MTGNIIARRYAKALFDLGRKRGSAALEDYAASLSALGEALAVSGDLARVLRDPVFSPREKCRVLEALGQKLGAREEMLNFWRLLADKNRLAELAGIAAAFGELLDEEKGILHGRLCTAIPLDKKRQAALTEVLRKKARRELAIEFDVNPEILGGVVLTLGDRVLDASLRAQLSLLQDTIRKGE